MTHLAEAKGGSIKKGVSIGAPRQRCRKIKMEGRLLN